MDANIAFPHLNQFYRDEILTFISGEKHHWTKQVRNAFDNNKWDLEVNDNRMWLWLCEECWKHITNTTWEKSSLSKYKFD